MDLNQLRTFVTVAEEQHLTRAAERLYTSQPAVSAQLKALEETLGLTLFDRTPKGMKLTPAGTRILQQATSTLEAARKLLGEAQALKGELFGELTIGIHTDFGFLKLAELVKQCSECYPNVKLTFVNGMSADIITDVRKGRLDGGFFFGPCKFGDLNWVQLASVEMVILGPAAWRDKINGASLDDLTRLPWVYTSERCPFFQHTGKLLVAQDLDPQKLVFVDSEDAIRTLVKEGLGIAVLRKQDAIQAQRENWGVMWSGHVPPISLNMAVPVRRMQEPLIMAWCQLVANLWADQEPLATVEETA